MFGQGTANTIEVGRIVGAPTTVCSRKSIVLLWDYSASYCSIVLLSTCVLLVKYLLPGGLLSRYMRRQHTRLLFDSVGCLDRQDCVYKHIVARN